ncbi:hypothetical protein DFH06DRAFT_1135983 [Mycena polygramma]|nr:hypothetical protein DFH06DRAFT_1135983 [Mycena polygramma]
MTPRVAERSEDLGAAESAESAGLIGIGGGIVGDDRTLDAHKAPYLVVPTIAIWITVVKPSNPVDVILTRAMSWTEGRGEDTPEKRGCNWPSILSRAPRTFPVRSIRQQTMVGRAKEYFERIARMRCKPGGKGQATEVEIYTHAGPNYPIRLVLFQQRKQARQWCSFVNTAQPVGQLFFVWNHRAGLFSFW